MSKILWKQISSGLTVTHSYISRSISDFFNTSTYKYTADFEIQAYAFNTTVFACESKLNPMDRTVVMSFTEDQGQSLNLQVVDKRLEFIEAIKGTRNIFTEKVYRMH